MRRVMLLFILLCLLLCGCARNAGGVALTPSELATATPFVPPTPKPSPTPRPTPTPAPTPVWSNGRETFARPFHVWLKPGALPEVDERLHADLFELYRQDERLHALIGPVEMLTLKPDELERLQNDERACINVSGNLYTFVDMQALEGTRFGDYQRVPEGVIGALMSPMRRTADEPYQGADALRWVQQWGDELRIIYTSTAESIFYHAPARELRFAQDVAIYVAGDTGDDFAYVKLMLDDFWRLAQAGRDAKRGGYAAGSVLPLGHWNAFGIVGDEIVYLVMLR